MPAFINIIGQRFHRLVAVEYQGKSRWKFNCDCGESVVARSADVKIGKTQSCGCFNKERITKHGYHLSSTYTVWNDMRQRCYNPNNKAFKWYGARGITVCNEWLDFRNFLADMGEKPPGLSIGRIDNNGNYCKNNCHWETQIQQSNNQRRNRLVTICGQTKTLAQWVAEIGINYSTARARIGYGWSDVDALTIPVGPVGVRRKA